MFFKMKPKVGNHRQRNKKGDIVTYTSGDVVESDIDLEERYPEKFERVNTPTAMTEESKKAVQEAAEEGAKDLYPTKDEPDPEEDEDEEEEDEEEEDDEIEEPELAPKKEKASVKKKTSVKKKSSKRKSGK